MFYDLFDLLNKYTTAGLNLPEIYLAIGVHNLITPMSRLVYGAKPQQTLIGSNTKPTTYPNLSKTLQDSSLILNVVNCSRWWWVRRCTCAGDITRSGCWRTSVRCSHPKSSWTSPSAARASSSRLTECCSQPAVLIFRYLSLLDRYPWHASPSKLYTPVVTGSAWY